MTTSLRVAFDGSEPRPNTNFTEPSSTSLVAYGAEWNKNSQTFLMKMVQGRA